MDTTGLVAVAMVIVLAFVVGSVRRRVVRLENMVLRLQDRVTDLRSSRPSATDGSPSTPIDVEPFVD